MKTMVKHLLAALACTAALVVALAPNAAQAYEDDNANTALLSQEETDSIEQKLGSAAQPSEPLLSTQEVSGGGANGGSGAGQLVVALDAGHGGNDSGAVGNFGVVRYVEKDINLRIARACAQELESYGVKAVLIRDSDTYIYSTNASLELAARCAKAHSAGANLYVSLHCNSGNGSTNGAEVWYPMDVPFNHNCYTTGRGVAQAILNGLTQNNRFGIRARGIFTRNYNENGGNRNHYSDGSAYDYYAVIRHSREYNIPGIIVEHGFIDNASDANSLNTNAEAMGRANADAIANYYGIDYTWEQEPDGQWKLKKGNNYVSSSWAKVSGSWYWFGSDGYMVTGWHEIGGRRYHLSASGAMDSGWLWDGGSWYWLGAADDGAMATGWQRVNGTWYLLDSGTGRMETGWQRVNGAWYYLDPSSGAMHTGWLLANGKWYWFEGSGAMATGWRNISGVWYWFDQNSGAAVQNTTLKINGATYAFGNSCAMAQNDWCYVGNQWYLAGGSGALQSGWHYVNGAWYWMDGSTYAMATGWHEIGGRRYHLSASGAMDSGWLWDGESWYWLGSSNDGAMATGWQRVNGTWYLLDPGTGRMETGWQEVGGKRYYLDPSSGAMHTGWLLVGGKWYWLDGSGALATSRWIGNYYVDETGAMVTNQWVGPYYTGSDGAWVPGYTKPTTEVQQPTSL